MWGNYKMSKLKQDFQHLSELIRKANELINPEDSISYLTKKDIRDRLYGTHPKCFLKLLPIGRDTKPYLIPLCNRGGFEDPKVIAVAIKMVQRIMSEKSDQFDPNDIQKVLNQLNHRNSVLSKTTPKPMSAGAQKAKVTRMFKQIKQYLDMNKTSGIGEE
jgi:hypothetical protein